MNSFKSLEFYACVCLADKAYCSCTLKICYILKQPTATVTNVDYGLLVYNTVDCYINVP